MEENETSPFGTCGLEHVANYYQRVRKRKGTLEGGDVYFLCSFDITVRK